MGVWGAGVFENDSAGDYLQTFPDFLVDVIQSGIYQLMLTGKIHPVYEYHIIGAAYLLCIFYAELDAVPIEESVVPKQWKHDFFKHSAIKRKNLGREPLNPGQYEMFDCVFNYIISYTEGWEHNLPIPDLPISVLWNHEFLQTSFHIRKQILDRLRTDINIGVNHLIQDNHALREQEFLATIHIYHMLLEKCDWYAYTYEIGIYSSMVHEWHQLFYEWWEKYQGENGKADYLAEHRIVIHETFNNFQHFIEAQTQRWKTKKGN